MREQTQSQRSDQSAFANALDERAEVSIELFLKEVSKTEEAPILPTVWPLGSHFHRLVHQHHIVQRSDRTLDEMGNNIAQS